MREYESMEKHFKQFRIFLILAHSGLIICHFLSDCHHRSRLWEDEKDEMSTRPEHFRKIYVCVCGKKEFGMGMTPEAVDEETLALL